MCSQLLSLLLLSSIQTVLMVAALVAFNVLTRIVRHLYYRFHVPHEVRSSALTDGFQQTLRLSELPRPVLSNILLP
jgi:hypothetical protein